MILKIAGTITHQQPAVWVIELSTVCHAGLRSIMKWSEQKNHEINEDFMKVPGLFKTFLVAGGRQICLGYLNHATLGLWDLSVKDAFKQSCQHLTHVPSIAVVHNPVCPNLLKSLQQEFLRRRLPPNFSNSAGILSGLVVFTFLK